MDQRVENTFGMKMCARGCHRQAAVCHCGVNCKGGGITEAWLVKTQTNGFNAYFYETIS